jgi:thioredoxin-dependent peroxiredoxin
VATITFLGNELHLVGEPPVAGERARDFLVHGYVAGRGMFPVTWADIAVKPRLISAVPSLDTPVCAQETITLNTRVAELGDAVAAYTVSVDLPFAQARWCGVSDVENMQSLSDYKTRSFGNSWGVLVEETQLLARAVFVVGADDVVTYAQVVPEITHEPDYEPILAALEALI